MVLAKAAAKIAVREKYGAAAAGTRWHTADGQGAVGAGAGAADAGLFPEMQAGTGNSRCGGCAAKAGTAACFAVGGTVGAAAARTKLATGQIR